MRRRSVAGKIHSQVLGNNLIHSVLQSGQRFAGFLAPHVNRVPLKLVLQRNQLHDLRAGPVLSVVARVLPGLGSLPVAGELLLQIFVALKCLLRPLEFPPFRRGADGSRAGLSGLFHSADGRLLG